MRRFFVHQLAQLVARGESDVVDLGEIVIFGGEPENGDMTITRLRGQPRPGERGRGLERREQRSTEKADLLAGDDDSGACLQSVNCGSGSRRRILCGE